MKQSLTEIASQLGLNLDTLERWIRQGKIPVSKQGRMGIYSASELNRWAEKQMRLNPCHVVDASENEPTGRNGKKGDDAPERILLTALRRGGLFYGIDGDKKTDILKAAVDRIPEFPGKDADTIFQQLMEREDLTSTGIGQGVAIPHPRNPIGDSLEAPMIVTCFLKQPIPFQSIDDQPVSIIFLLLSPTVEVHLKLLSRLSFCLRDKGFIQLIKTAPNDTLFFSRIKEMEATLEG